MTQDLTYPEALDTFLTRLPELELLFGPPGKTGLEQVRRALQTAVAARAQGDVARAVQSINTAMETLSQLADLLDPQEAMMMRMVAAQFRQALGRGDDNEARRVSDVMREKSGATIKKKS